MAMMTVHVRPVNAARSATRARTVSDECYRQQRRHERDARGQRRVHFDGSRQHVAGTPRRATTRVQGRLTIALVQQLRGGVLDWASLHHWARYHYRQQRVDEEPAHNRGECVCPKPRRLRRIAARLHVSTTATRRRKHAMRNDTRTLPRTGAASMTACSDSGGQATVLHQSGNVNTNVGRKSMVPSAPGGPMNS